MHSAGQAGLKGVPRCTRDADDARASTSGLPPDEPLHTAGNPPRHLSSENSTSSVTRASKARPSSARCAAIRTSSWCIGCIRSCRLRTPTCTASSGTSGSMPRALAGDVTAALDKLPRGATSISDFSPHLEEAVERGWALRLAALRRLARPHRAPHRSASCKTPGLEERARRHFAEFAKIKAEDLSDDFAKIVGGFAGRCADGAATAAGAARARRGERRHRSGADGQAGGAEPNSPST